MPGFGAIGESPIGSLPDESSSSPAVGFIPHRLLLLLPWPEIGRAFAGVPTVTIATEYLEYTAPARNLDYAASYRTLDYTAPEPR